MVAEMTAFGTADNFNDGNEDVSPQDQKDTLADNGNSGSDSTEDSSEDEEPDETSHENTTSADESNAACRDQDQDATPETCVRSCSEEERLAQTCCAKCQDMQQNEEYESVTPRVLSRGWYLMSLEDEGTYRCAATGLVFEVSQKVKVRYKVLSWSKYGTFLKGSWKSAGPIFDVKCEPSVLKSIRFPHSLCLADPDSEVTFHILHVKNNGPAFEPSAEHSRSYIKWTVTSLSPVGPIVQTPEPAEHHGVVLIYKEVAQRPSSSFRIYLATNNRSDINDIKKELQRSKKKYVKMEKPPTCQRLLKENSKYRLMSEPEGEISPEDFLFTLEVVMLRPYFEAFFEQAPPFKLSLVEVDSGQTVWTATLRQGDCEDQVIEKPRERSKCRKRSSSSSEEELGNKKAKHEDLPDGLQTTCTPDVTDKQLMTVAMKMGKEWQQVSILYLGLTMQDIEKVQDDNLTMRKFKVLVEWRQKSKGGASVARLYEALNKDDVPIEVRDVLEGMVPRSCL